LVAEKIEEGGGNWRSSPSPKGGVAEAKRHHHTTMVAVQRMAAAANKVVEAGGGSQADHRARETKSTGSGRSDLTKPTQEITK
jgi:hypothetical protein